MTDFSGKKLYILGAGGHGFVLLDLCRALGVDQQVIGYLDRSPEKHGDVFFEKPVLGDDSFLTPEEAGQSLMINGMGSADIRGLMLRKKIYNLYSGNGFQFAGMVHPSVIHSSDFTISSGVQLMAGVVMQHQVRVGPNTIINTGATLDHGVTVEGHCHISPGVTICGDVKVGEMTHVGAGSTIIQGIKIGKNSVVGAGSVVLADVPDNSVYAGVPAKLLRENSGGG